MRNVTPNSWADTKAYIVDGHDHSGEAVSFGRGQHVRIVDNTADADITIRVSKGRGNFLSAPEARALAHRGSGTSGGDSSRQGKWFVKYMIFSALLWLGLSIAVTASGDVSIGGFFALLLITPVVMVIWAPMLRLIRKMVF